MLDEGFPAGHQVYWSGHFLTALPNEAIDTLVAAGRSELAPVQERSYVGFVDPSGGARDAMTLAIAHPERDLVVLDAVRERRPPFSPAAVVEEFAHVLREYDVGGIAGDRYGGEWPRERFRAHGIAYAPAGMSKRPSAALSSSDL